MKASPSVRGAVLLLSLAACVFQAGLPSTARSAPAQGLNLSSLQLVSPEAVPFTGGFYFLQKLDSPPLPYNPFPELPVYSLGGGLFLVDDRTVDYAAIQQQAEMETAILELLGLAQNANAGSGLMTMQYASNDLWLEITSFDLTNKTLSLILHGTQAGHVYELMSQESLTNETWLIEQPLHAAAGQGWTPATVLMLNRTNSLFFQARDWTGLDEDADSLPDWWEFEHFRGFQQTGSGDFDGDGVNNLAEFNAGTDPNTIKALVHYSALRTSSTNMSASVEVQAGVPSKITVLVDNTNLLGASWTTYSANFNVNFSADGAHTVTVGLKGSATNSRPIWRSERITLDRVPPVIVVTNPAPGVTSLPMIQLRGYCNEAILTLTYDLTNSARIATNQPGRTTSRYFDIAQRTYTTNFFTCYDIDLAPGSNSITLRATDWAGNVSVTNLTYNVVSTNTPPSFVVNWPQEGTIISGDAFTLDGWLTNPTARISLRLVDTNGNTNEFPGLVERNGRFWIEHLPLAAGSNTFTLTATDVWSNTVSTNLTVVKGNLVLTTDPIDPTYLTRPTITVTGTVSDSGATVWVNGVQATVTGTNWQADGVPFTHGGTARFNVKAYPPEQEPRPGPSENPAPPDGSGPQEVNPDVEALDGIYLEGATNSISKYTFCRTEDWYNGIHGAPDYWHQEELTYSLTNFWLNLAGGRGKEITLHHDTAANGFDSSDACTNTITWPAMDWGSQTGGTIDYCNGEVDAYSLNHVTEESCHVDDPNQWSSGPEEIEDAYHQLYSTAHQSDESYNRTAQAQVTLYAGGKSISHRKSLFALHASAKEILNRRAVPPYDPSVCPMRDIAATNLELCGKRLAADGVLYLVLEDGESQDVTPQTQDANFYLFGVDRSKYPLIITANGAQLDPDRVVTNARFCVGQDIEFALPLAGLSGIQTNLYQWGFGGSLALPRFGGQGVNA